MLMDEDDKNGFICSFSMTKSRPIKSNSRWRMLVKLRRARLHKYLCIVGKRATSKRTKIRKQIKAKKFIKASSGLLRKVMSQTQKKQIIHLDHSNLPLYMDRFENKL